MIESLLQRVSAMNPGILKRTWFGWHVYRYGWHKLHKQSNEDYLLGAILEDTKERLRLSYPSGVMTLQYGSARNGGTGWYFNGGAGEGDDYFGWSGFDEFEPLLAALRGYLEFLEHINE